MRVALACPNFPPEFLGGTERVVLALARSLVELGDQVVVLTGSDVPHRGADVVAEQLDGIAVRRVPRRSDEGYGLDLRRPRVLDACARVLVNQRCEVLHVHHWSTLSSGLVRRARELGLGTVVTLHDMWTTCPRFFRRPPHGIRCPERDGRDACAPCVSRNLDGGVQQLAGQLALRDAELRAEVAGAHAVTVPSRACRERIAEHLPFAGALEVVPHGLLEPIDAAPAARPAGGKLRIGTFGNLVEEKGIAHLVHDCGHVPDCELHLYGPFLDPVFERHVKALAERHRVDLHCHGPYDRHRAHPAWSLDLAVFPSHCEETYGLVVEEALARGVPVVVSDRGALAERIGGGGIAVSVDTTGPLERLLFELARDRGRLDALRAGIPRQFATIHDAAQRYRAAYTASRAKAPSPARER